jgi:exoribonuclease-2
MFLEGRIIEYLDSDNLRVGFVRKQEHDRLHLVDPRGRNVSVNGDRVVIVHRAASEAEFPGLAKQIVDQALKRQTEVDVELLWQSLRGQETPLQPGELAGLFFSDNTPEASSAVFRALFQDTLFFKRKGVQFVPKSEQQVEIELVRRKREREHEEFRRQATAIISDLVRKKNTVAGPDATPILDRIHNWLRYRNGDEVGTILEEIAGASRARDAAFDILVKTGRIHSSADRFLVVAGVDERFSPAVQEIADRLTVVTHKSIRTDYRDIPAFTIDDEDTREVDDALTVFQANGETVVGVHIADVSAYVNKGDLLDGEAARRSSTIYLPAATVRMFPDRLSTDLASLNAATDRPAYTVEIRFDSSGRQVGYRIVLSTLRVSERLSYDEADRRILNGDERLGLLYSIAVNLLGARADRGAITFRRPELKIRVYGDDVRIRRLDPNSPSRTLVSEMMVMANGLSADFAALNSLPVIFRTQEPREALSIENAPVAEAIAFERLRKTFKRSRLSLTPGAHSGLGLTAYTQISSPIRRYADLVTQRQFTAMLAGNPVPHGREELLQILAAAEAAEVEIRQLEERSTQYWLLQYLARQKLTEAMPAIVMDSKGNVELEEYYLRAKVPGGIKAAPGSRTHVRIESIDPAKGDIRLAVADGSQVDAK